MARFLRWGNGHKPSSVLDMWPTMHRGGWGLASPSSPSQSVPHPLLAGLCVAPWFSFSGVGHPPVSFEGGAVETPSQSRVPPASVPLSGDLAQPRGAARLLSLQRPPVKCLGFRRAAWPPPRRQLYSSLSCPCVSPAHHLTLGLTWSSTLGRVLCHQASCALQGPEQLPRSHQPDVSSASPRL